MFGVQTGEAESECARACVKGGERGEGLDAVADASHTASVCVRMRVSVCVSVCMRMCGVCVCVCVRARCVMGVIRVFFIYTCTEKSTFRERASWTWMSHREPSTAVACMVHVA